MKIGFLFPGQGAQYVGMGQDFYEQYGSARKLYDTFPYRDLCFQGPQETLNDTFYTQSCLLVTSLAIAEVLKEEGIVPIMSAGLSLGEYSALTYAGVFDFSDAYHVVSHRGQIMAEALPKGTTKMAAILGSDPETIRSICEKVSQEKEICTIANLNCPGQTVITGTNAAVDQACELLKEAGAKRCVALDVSGAFHSPLLQEAGQKLKAVLEDVRMHKPKMDVVFNVNGEICQENLKDLLVQQIQSPVLMQKSIETMIENGIDTFICIGPGHTLRGFVKKIDRQCKVYSVEKVEDVKKVKEELYGK